MTHIDSTDVKASVLGFIFSTVMSFIKLGIIDFFISLGAHLLYGAAGALGGLIIAKLWKKYIDKKK